MNQFRRFHCLIIAVAIIALGTGSVWSQQFKPIKSNPVWSQQFKPSKANYQYPNCLLSLLNAQKMVLNRNINLTHYAHRPYLESRLATADEMVTYVFFRSYLEVVKAKNTLTKSQLDLKNANFSMDGVNSQEVATAIDRADNLLEKYNITWDQITKYVNASDK